MMLDAAPLKAVRDAMEAVGKLDCVREVPAWMRVETMDG